MRPHGVRGELRAKVLTDHPERLASVEILYVGEKLSPHKVMGVRQHQDAALIMLEGYEDRTAAEVLRGSLLYVTVEDAVPLDEDEFYEFQIEGLAVVTDEGELLGEIVEVFTAPGANDVFVVHGPLGELLIPAIEDVVIELNPDAGRIVVHPLPGLLPDHP
ncbi:MAG: ribosome maturation factor RimM [Anaerolineae bacterium]|nr:ribosome maturation factor RimM [Anaerolineae bacterium]